MVKKYQEPKTLVISVPKFKKWQRKTDKHRHYIAFDCNFYEDARIQELQRISHAATHVYIWILTKLNFETASLIIREDFLRTAIKTALGKSCNNYDLMGLLKTLEAMGLITYSVEDHAQLDARLKEGSGMVDGRLNEGSGMVDARLKESRGQVASSKPPQIQAELESFLDKNRSEKEKITRSDLEGGGGFSSFAENGKNYLAKQKSPNLPDISWALGYLEGVKIEHDGISEQALLECWQKVCDIAFDNGARSPQYYKTVFENLVNSSLGRHSPICEYEKDWRGEFVPGRDGSEPGNDPNIPDEQLGLESLSLRVQQFFTDGKPDPQFYSHPRLRLYFEKYERDYPGLVKKKWPEAYEAILKTTRGN